MRLFAMLLVSLLSAIFLCCLLIPSVWAVIIAGDEGLDAHESGVMRVSSRKSSFDNNVL
jgi:hypothetical protein